MSEEPDKKKKVSLTALEKRTAAAKLDEDFFAQRKKQDAANLAKTVRLRTQRLAHEAANPKPVKKNKR